MTKQKKGKNKKAVFFSIDALIALTIILLTITVIYPLIRYSEKESYVPEDIISSLSALKIGEMNSSLVEGWRINGKITDLNKSVLEQIGEFYVSNNSDVKNMAKLLAEEVLLTINTNENIGIYYDGKLLASQNKTSWEDAKDRTVENQVISGIKEGNATTGYSARAFLTNTEQTKYYYFGGYVGEGNISLNVEYNGTLTKIELETAANKQFNIYINNNFSGSYAPALDELEPLNFPDLDSYKTYFHEGSNTFKLVPDDGKTDFHVAGGYLKLTYSDGVQYEQPKKYYFPGIDGIINIYDGFYVPGDLKTLKVSLHYDSNYTLALNIGNTTVFNKSHDGETTETIDDATLKTKLNYASLSNKTVPLRLGLLGFGAGGGNADVILVTDLSGSMDWRMDSDNNGVTRTCGDLDNLNNPIYSSSTKRLSLAKCLDKMFIDIILNSPGNKVGIVGFYGDDNSPNKGRVYDSSLTNDSTSLKSGVDDYSPQGGTPICAAINDAYRILNSQSSSDRKKYIIVMSDGVPTHTCGSMAGGGTTCDGTRDGTHSNEALWLGNGQPMGARCYGGFDDCEVADCQCASDNSNWSSCRAHNELGATVYSIGFGPVTSCTMANKTLRNVAGCGGGEYYASNNATVLAQFYRSIANEIVRLSYIEQISVTEGNFKQTKLYPDSYLEFDYTKTIPPYGLVTTYENQFINDYEGNFEIPADSNIVETKVVSYSGSRWTKDIKINNNVIYNLSMYGSNYVLLGDPYAINIPNSYVQGNNFNNIIRLTTGISPSNTSAGSSSNKIIYTVVKNMVSYSAISSSANGCNWSVQFEDYTNLTMEIPPGATDPCYYRSDNHQEPAGDALQTAVYNLFKKLDNDGDYKVDVKFEEQNLQVSSSEVTGIPYPWETTVQVRKWW